MRPESLAPVSLKLKPLAEDVMEPASFWLSVERARLSEPLPRV